MKGHQPKGKKNRKHGRNKVKSELYRIRHKIKSWKRKVSQGSVKNSYLRMKSQAFESGEYYRIPVLSPDAPVPPWSPTTTTQMFADYLGIKMVNVNERHGVVHVVKVTNLNIEKSISPNRLAVGLLQDL